MITRPQAPRSGAFLLGFKLQKFPTLPLPGVWEGGGPSQGGPARIYISRHPQPPAKYIGFYGLSQSLYTRVKTRVDSSRALGYSGIMNNIYKKGLDLTYLRGQVIALMKLSANIQTTINKLEAQIKEEEKNEK